MKNIGQMLKQAQKMQAKMAEVQESLATHEITGGAGAGLVSVTLNGKGEMRGIKIDPSLIEGGDAEMLEELSTTPRPRSRRMSPQKWNR